MANTHHVYIRKAEAKDVTLLLEFIKELAVFEKAPQEVSNTEERMLKEGFGENPAFDAFIAEEAGKAHGKALGVAITYFRYSTWKGRRLYLEDLIVSEHSRGKGVGRLLLNHVVEYSRSMECSGVMWQVLDWNEPAILFYERYGARLESEWINCHIDF